MVKRVGGKSLTDGGAVFRVKKCRKGFTAEDVEEQRQAAIEFWSQRNKDVANADDHDPCSSSSYAGGTECNTFPDADTPVDSDSLEARPRETE